MQKLELITTMHNTVYLAMLNVCCEMSCIDLPILVSVLKPYFRARMDRNDTVPSSNLDVYMHVEE